MKSIISHLGGDDFPRIRVGIGGERHPDMDLADYVLGHFSGEEKKQLEEALDKVVKAAELIALDEMDEAMNRYSVGKKQRKKKEKKNWKEEAKQKAENVETEERIDKEV